MAKRREIERPTTKSIHSYVTKNAGRVKQTQRLPHHRAESVRTAEYRGHHIVVKTRYAIEVDGRPVMGHLGLTPQSIHQLGGFRAQGKTAIAAKRLLEDALLLEDAGCFSLVLESVPARLAELISKQ